MQRFSKLIAIVLLATITFSTCKKKPVNPTPEPPTNNNGNPGGSGGNTGGGGGTSNTITLTINVLNELNRIGKTTQAEAIVKDANGNVVLGKTISWNVTDPNPISVSTTGLVTALSAGVSKLRAYVDNVAAEVTITVGANQTEVSKSLGCLCELSDFPNNNPVVFTAPIMKVEDLSTIYPLGYMWKGHVTPIDHQYYYPNNLLLQTPPEYPVYSPADGYIVKVGRTSSYQVEQALGDRDNYDITIQHSCNTYTYLSLITSLTPEMMLAFGEVPRGTSKNVYVKVSAGQQIARVGGQSLDVCVFDNNTPAKQWVIPSHYTEVGKKYATDPFLYYTPTLKNALLAKTISSSEPRGGRFDYDVDGKLVGTWFLQGTNGSIAP